jgi:hypothetical protein
MYTPRDLKMHTQLTFSITCKVPPEKVELQNHVLGVDELLTETNLGMSHSQIACIIIPADYV